MSERFEVYLLPKSERTTRFDVANPIVLATRIGNSVMRMQLNAQDALRISQGFAHAVAELMAEDN